jgi:peptidyl-prolyl cis-trans isomerase C
MILAISSVLVFGSSGCGSRASVGAAAAAVATVNGESLSNAAFERFVAVKLGVFADESLDDAVRSELLDEFVKRQVMLQAAASRGLKIDPPAPRPDDPEAERVLGEQAIDSIVERYYREVVLKDVRLTPDEVASYYAAHRDSYSSATGLYAREIRVRTREEADTALRSIASGCAFADVAREVSTAPTASRGGLAYYESGALPPRFARAMAPLAAGQMSSVVKSNLGYHIFLLERRGDSQPLDLVRDRVADDARANKNEQLVEANMERLLDDAKVTINRDRLPFQYEGRFAP